jgi:hypothetical protein
VAQDDAGMNDLKTALDAALRHSAAQQRRYRVDDPHERLVLQAAAAFRALLGQAELAPHLEILLREVQEAGRRPDRREQV